MTAPVMPPEVGVIFEPDNNVNLKEVNRFHAGAFVPFYAFANDV
jgi:hypothetical protein